MADEEGEQNPPKKKPIPPPGWGGELDSASEEMKGFEPKLRTSELPELSTSAEVAELRASELKPLERKQGSKEKDKE